MAIVARIRALLERLRACTDLNLLLVPHVGSVTIEYNPLQISQSQLLARVHGIESSIEATIDISVPCRELRLPLVMDHPEIQKCIQRYMETVRSKAAYLPDNLEYLRKCNGLNSRREVFNMMLNTDFVVVAVGFLYGAPILFPLSPKSIRCQKYNPTRVSTPGGTFGIGGSILSGYPIEQPGGYMMVARTLEMWDSFGTKPGFSPSKPWLFEPFDLVKFYEVSVDGYDALATEFAAGRYQWQISNSTFDIGKAYDLFQKAREDPDVIEYKEKQRQGLLEQEEIEKDLYTKWQAEASSNGSLEENGLLNGHGDDNKKFVSSLMAANVWKVEVEKGDILKEGQVVAILEAMKMEVKVVVPSDLVGFEVTQILRKAKSIVSTGEPILIARSLTV